MIWQLSLPTASVIKFTNSTQVHTKETASSFVRCSFSLMEVLFTILLGLDSIYTRTLGMVEMMNNICYIFTWHEYQFCFNQMTNTLFLNWNICHSGTFTKPLISGRLHKQILGWTSVSPHRIWSHSPSSQQPVVITTQHINNVSVHKKTQLNKYKENCLVFTSSVKASCLTPTHLSFSYARQMCSPSSPPQPTCIFHILSL